MQRSVAAQARPPRAARRCRCQPFARLFHRSASAPTAPSTKEAENLHRGHRRAPVTARSGHAGPSAGAVHRRRRPPDELSMKCCEIAGYQRLRCSRVEPQTIRLAPPTRSRASVRAPSRPCMSSHPTVWSVTRVIDAYARDSHPMSAHRPFRLSMCILVLTGWSWACTPSPRRVPRRRSPQSRRGNPGCAPRRRCPPAI